MAVSRLIGTVHAVRIELTGDDPGHPDVPDVTGTVARGIQLDDPGGLGVFRMVEKLEADAASVATEDRKVDPA